jgi:hypothetical protein
VRSSFKNPIKIFFIILTIYTMSTTDTLPLPELILESKTAPLVFPEDMGFPTYQLSTDGNNNFSWTPASSGSEPARIINTGMNTYVTTELTPADNTVRIVANSVPTITSTSTTTTINNILSVQSANLWSVRTTTTNVSSVAATDNILRWNGTANGTVSLPAAASHPGRKVIIENINATFLISIGFAGGDTIGGSTAAFRLTNQYDRASFVSDGVTDWMIFNG